MVLPEPGRGLNGAVEAGVARLAALGASEVLVAHADLPMAHGLARLAGFDGVTLVPDRRDDGTNVVCVPAGAMFRFAYGPGSFVRHRAEAERLGTALPGRAATRSGLGRRRPRRTSPPSSSRRLDSDPGGRGLPLPSVLPVGNLPTHGAVSVDLPVPSVALAVAAHPDDVEFGCGATLAKWAAGGCRIHHLILTDGSKGTWAADDDVAQLVERRHGEQRQAARRAGGGTRRPRCTSSTGPTASSRPGWCNAGRSVQVIRQVGPRWSSGTTRGGGTGCTPITAMPGGS